MLGVGLGVRLLVAAAPASPVKAPLPLSSSLRRRSSSWWFSNGNAHERDSATATGSTSSRAARRKWWSDPEPGQQEYGYSSLEDEEEEDYEEEDEAAFPGLGVAGELFDEPWFSKVFKTNGFLLPVMLVSMLAATGLKAFLMAMAIPLGQSAISFILDAIWGRRRRSNRDDRRRPFQQEEDDEDDYPEDTTDFATGGRGKKYNNSSNYYEERRRQQRYQSWVSNDFAGATPDGDNSEGGEGNKSSANFGGWDELLNYDNATTQEKSSSSSFSAGNADYSKRQRPAVTGEEDTDAAAAGRGAGQGLGAPPARMRMRRQRGMPRTTGLGGTRYKQAPILMRLLVAVFPFLGSWFRLLEIEYISCLSCNLFRRTLLLSL